MRTIGNCGWVCRGLIITLGLVLACEPARSLATEDLDPAPLFTQTAPLGAVIEARPGAGPALDLEQCVANALRANDFLAAERMRMDELDGQMDQALSTGLPTLDLVGDWTRSRDPSCCRHSFSEAP